MFQRQVTLAITTADGDGMEVKDLRIDFDVERTVKSGTGIIRVWNMAEASSKQAAEAGGHILLRAGYADEAAATVFSGDIAKGTREYIENDYITTLEVHDGRKAVIGSRVSVSYNKGTDAGAVASDLIAAINLPCIGADKVTGALPHGWCYFGMALDALNELIARYDLGSTIQDGTLYIAKPGEVIDDAGMTLTMADGSLLTMPQSISDISTVADDTAEVVNAWAFNAKPLPYLYPMAKCKVESDTFTGDVIIKRVRLHGSNAEGTFTADVVAEAA